MAKVYAQHSSHSVDDDGYDLIFDPDELLSDDKNPRFMFALTDTDLLLQIARKRIDPRYYAIKELINRQVPPALWTAA